MVGTVLNGRYRVTAHLGAGGMASVYLADDLAEGRRVAVKVLSAADVPDRDMLERFEREFAACRRIAHPNVVSLYEFGRLPDGACFYAMEYLPCPTLAEVLEARGRRPPAEAKELLVQLAKALQHVHRADVVHRDLKPGNLMVTEEGRLVVMDFGLARDQARTKLTKTGTALGTPTYMAPETLRGRSVDLRADLWQWGVIAYELVTGQSPFLAGTLGEVVTRIMTLDPAPPSGLVAGLPHLWDDVILRCLRKERAERYQSADELLLDLQRLPLEQERPEPSPRPASSRSSSPRPAPPARPVRYVAWGAALTSVALVLGALALRGPRDASAELPGATPTPRPALTVAVSSARATGRHGMELTLRPSDRAVPATVVATWPVALEVRARPLDDGAVVALFEPFDERTRELTVVLGASGQEQRVPLGAPLRREVVELTARLGSMEPREVGRELTDRSWRTFSAAFDSVLGASAPRPQVQEEERALAQRCREAARSVQERLIAHPSWSAYRRAVALAPLIFDGDLVPSDQRFRLWAQVNRFNELRLRAGFVYVPLDLEQPSAAVFAATTEPPGDGWLSSSALDARARPLVLGQLMPFAPAGVQPRWRGSVPLAGVARAAEAEVRVTFLRFRNVTLRLRVNGGLELLLHDLPLRPLKPAELTLRQRVPVAALREGANDVDLAFEPLMGLLSDYVVRVLSVEVCFRPGEGP